MNNKFLAFKASNNYLSSRNCKTSDKRGPNPHGNKLGVNIISKNQIEEIEVELPSDSHSERNSEESKQNQDEEE